MTGYRSLRRGVGDFKLLRGHFFLARNYILGNWSDSFLINASVIYNNNNDYLSSNTNVNANFIQTTSILIEDRRFWSANLTADKFVEFLSSNFKLKVNASKNQYQNIVNQSDLRDIVTTTFSYGGEYKSVFSGPFNFHLGTNWTKTIIKTPQSNNNLDNISFVDIKFKLGERLLLSIKNENYFFGNLQSDKNFTFSDLEAFYNIKKNKYRLSIKASNVFNTNSFSNLVISDTGFYRNDFRLLPRYFLMNLNLDFERCPLLFIILYKCPLPIIDLIRNITETI